MYRFAFVSSIKRECWQLSTYDVSMFRGVGAMEIVAMDMKLRGAYIARQLSFYGVNFNIDEVGLTQEFIKTYDSSVQLVSCFVLNSHLFRGGTYCCSRYLIVVGGADATIYRSGRVNAN